MQFVSRRQCLLALSGPLMAPAAAQHGGDLAQIALVGPVTGAEPLRTPFNPNLFHVRAGHADEMEHMVNLRAQHGRRRRGPGGGRDPRA